MVLNASGFEKKLMFMLGLLSTLQLIEVAGMTVFTYMMFICVIYFLFKYKNIIIVKGETLIFIGLVTVSEILLFMDTRYNKWLSRSLNSYILLILVIALYSYMTKLSKESISAFLKGLYTSCLIQLVWCYIQFIMYNVYMFNINDFVFRKIFHSNLIVSQYKNGTMIITGLNNNAGVLVPIILVGIVLSEKKLMKFLFMAIALLAGSITPIIAIMGYVAAIIAIKIFYLISKLLRGEKLKIKRRTSRWDKVIILFILMAVVVFLIIYMRGRISSSFANMQQRIYNLMNDKKSDASSIVHLRYYTSLPFILKNIGISKVLFGYGLRAAGIPFVEFFNQYTTILWVPESDIITYILNVGILGAAVFAIILIKNIVKGIQVDERYVLLQISIIFAGIFYGIQLNWLILLEFLVMELIRRKVKLSEAIGINLKGWKS